MDGKHIKMKKKPRRELDIRNGDPVGLYGFFLVPAKRENYSVQIMAIALDPPAVFGRPQPCWPRLRTPRPAGSNNYDAPTEYPGDFIIGEVIPEYANITSQPQLGLTHTLYPATISTGACSSMRTG
ncbi:hypothetical protein FIBSPDRAFT_885911 [Athelia psychrophila]|uniref:Uncharacterized protein n=1 Tax=Athelia psychrophila TaxID=1759441 RepID=A0A166RJV0_9AGAM|nr:hypothetical protein FIBSPDRAFT_885911 [Fibularhizoctonia sp. CBS 109695]